MANCVRRSIDDFDDIGSHGQYQRMLEEGFSESEALTLVNKRSRIIQTQCRLMTVNMLGFLMLNRG
ncbi:MAG: hypothetical protein ACLRWM_11025 [Streptococcus sp.]